MKLELRDRKPHILYCGKSGAVEREGDAAMHVTIEIPEDRAAAFRSRRKPAD